MFIIGGGIYIIDILSLIIYISTLLVLHFCEYIFLTIRFPYKFIIFLLYYELFLLYMLFFCMIIIIIVTGTTLGIFSLKNFILRKIFTPRFLRIFLFSYLRNFVSIHRKVHRNTRIRNTMAYNMTLINAILVLTFSSSTVRKKFRILNQRFVLFTIVFRITFYLF